MGLRTYAESGPRTLVTLLLGGYTQDMKRITIRIAVATLVAALLFTPQAHAAKNKKAKAKPSAVAAQAKALIDNGMTALDAKDFDAAIRRFERAVQLEGTSAGYFMLGWAHYQRGFKAGAPENADRADAEETVNAYSMAITLDPELLTIAQPHRLYHSLAMSYEALKAYDKAVEAYKMAFHAAPANPMLPLYAARMRFVMGAADKAASNVGLAMKKAKAAGQEKSILNLLKNDPYFAVMSSDPMIQDTIAQASGAQAAVEIAQASVEPGTMRDSVSSGASLRRDMPVPSQNPAVIESLTNADNAYTFRRYRQAVELYEETLAIDAQQASLNPTQLSVLYERMGTAYNKLGLSGEAVRTLQKSLQQMPSNAASFYQIALAYSVSGKFSESLKALGSAFDAAPSTGELRKLMLLAKTDTELEPVRDLPAYEAMMAHHSDRVARR